MTVFKTDEF